MQQALDAFKNAGADDVRLMVLADNDTIRTRVSDRGYEFHPLDVERWAKLEGAIADGQTQQLLNRRRTDRR